MKLFFMSLLLCVGVMQGSDVLRTDPFFTQDHTAVFRNDPFFNQGLAPAHVAVIAHQPQSQANAPDTASADSTDSCIACIEKCICVCTFYYCGKGCCCCCAKSVAKFRKNFQE